MCVKKIAAAPAILVLLFLCAFFIYAFYPRFLCGRMDLL